MSVIERKLAEKCAEFGLPPSFDTLMRHMENNHAATVGAQKDHIATLERQLAGAVELAEAVKAVMGTLNFYIGPAARTAVSRESVELYRRIERALADFGGR